MIVDNLTANLLDFCRLQEHRQSILHYKRGVVKPTTSVICMFERINVKHVCCDIMECMSRARLPAAVVCSSTLMSEHETIFILNYFGQ